MYDKRSKPNVGVVILGTTIQTQPYGGTEGRQSEQRTAVRVRVSHDSNTSGPWPASTVK